MKTAISLLAVATLHAGAAGQQQPDAFLPILEQGADEWSLVWNDEFDGADADLEKRWVSQNGPSTHILSSRWRENARVSDGTLRLINRKESRGGQEWTSGNIWTRETFQYGYFECRYRYAAAPATNNSFWIMTRRESLTPEQLATHINGRPPKGAMFEIDINEGHYPATVNTNIHNWSDLIEVNGKKRSQSASRSITFGTQPDRILKLETPVTAHKIRLTSNHQRHFHVREFRIFAPQADGRYPDIFSPVPEDGPTDLARDQANRIQVSGIFGGRLEPGMSAEVRNLSDNNPSTSWISQSQGQKWIEIEFPEPRVVGSVQFLNGWRSGDQWTGTVDDYRLEYHDGREWIEMTSFGISDMSVNFARDFNVFGLEWDEEKIVFYLNGREIRREPNKFCHSPAPIWLSLAIIAWHGRVTDAIDGTFMEVDYVRVFQRRR